MNQIFIQDKFTSLFVFHFLIDTYYKAVLIIFHLIITIMFKVT